MGSNISFLKKATKAVAKSAKESLNKNKNFDNKIKSKGINSVSIDEVAKRLNIKKTKNGFFSPNDYNKMLKYAKKHTNSQDDLDMFRRRIDFVNNTQFDKNMAKKVEAKEKPKQKHKQESEISKANSKHWVSDKTKFDNEIEFEGINTVPIETIAIRVKARKNKWGMYTYSSMNKILRYGEEHSIDSEEYAVFKRRLNDEMNKQREEKSEKLKNSGIKSLPKERQEKVNAWIESKGGHEPSDIVEIITIRRLFTPSNQQQMIKDIMTKTWWGKCAIGEPRIKKKPNENVEIWKMRIPLIQVNLTSTPKNSYQRDMRRLYKRCMMDCGHDPLY